MYYVAFFKSGAAEMQRQVAWAAGKPGDEDSLLSLQSDTEAYYGRLVKARNFSDVRWIRLSGTTRTKLLPCGKRMLLCEKRSWATARLPNWILRQRWRALLAET
jgi:hypothetical protein